MSSDPHHLDPGSRLEDSGIPDLQDGTPEQQAEDPQEMPLPGNAPGASVDWGTTAEEQREGEPLDARLRRELPDRALTEIADDLDADGPADSLDSADRDRTDAEYEPVGRLRNDQRLEPGDEEVDTEATDVGMDGGGLSAEERAMHLEPE